MFENCREPNDYIEVIFKNGLMINHSRIVDGSEIDGYYLNLQSRPKSQISKLRQWERLFVNVTTKSKKIYGELDTENSFAQCLLWVYEELLNIVNGQNDKFPIEKDIKTLLLERENEIVPYILTCVELKLKTYIGSKRNPNYIVTQKNGKREFERVNFYYLDDDKGPSKYDILEDIIKENDTGEMTEFLLEKLLESDTLTKKQRQYIETVLSDDHYISESKVYNLNGEVVYNCNQYFFFNRQLCKEMARIIEEDEGLFDTGNRIVFR